MLFVVPAGATVEEVGRALSEANLLRSEFWFKVWSHILPGRRIIKSGEYQFAESLSIFSLLNKLSRGKFEVVPIRVTIPEGTSVRQIAGILEEKLSRFDSVRFLETALRKEGYLFPDTYGFPKGISEQELLEAMQKNFEKRLAPFSIDIERFGKSLSDIIVMASLLEEEARTSETRRQVAGILWKRLRIGMPLQVDAVFPYIFQGKPYNLTNGDLKVESPYNTYIHTGLPPTPITNPGLDSIRAALTPIETKYFYYLSDKSGTMHYAVTHDEHLANRAKYLGK
jgi:UPF0755 protein